MNTAAEKLDREYKECEKSLNRYVKAISQEGNDGFSVLTALK